MSSTPARSAPCASMRSTTPRTTRVGPHRSTSRSDARRSAGCSRGGRPHKERALSHGTTSPRPPPTGREDRNLPVAPLHTMNETSMTTPGYIRLENKRAGAPWKAQARRNRSRHRPQKPHPRQPFVLHDPSGRRKADVEHPRRAVGPLGASMLRLAPSGPVLEQRHPPRVRAPAVAAIASNAAGMMAIRIIRPDGLLWLAPGVRIAGSRSVRERTARRCLSQDSRPVPALPSGCMRSGAGVGRSKPRFA
jgi:hypothetical protein